MIKGQKVVLVMPAYNAALTLEQTFREVPFPLVDEVILTDDKSTDNTAHLARQLGIHYVLEHAVNLGYGGNQKTCYQKALAIDADIVVMLHPDYQYTPKLIESMVYLIANGVYDVVIGSRILGKGAIRGGMPIYKYIANRFLTLAQNLLMGQKLSEYHTGYRAFSRKALESIDFTSFSNDFIFDNQMLAALLFNRLEVGEVSCPTLYFKEASSINFKRSVQYGFGVLGVSVRYFFKRILG